MMEFNELYLPEGAVLVERMQEEFKGLIITMDKSKPNRGTIVAACDSLKEFIGKTVVFRENFSEEIDIEDKKGLLYFRDFNSSIYYAK